MCECVSTEECDELTTLYSDATADQQNECAIALDEAEAAEASDLAINGYKYARAAEYPSIEDQLDDLYHNGLDGWRTTIQAIKNRHPKPTS